MEVLRDIVSIKRMISEWKKQDLQIGLVPTMGALHEGHLTLVRKAKDLADRTICSIYVNPSQFNNPTDLSNYPRPIEDDLKKLEAAGCDVAFCPVDAEMYAENDKLEITFGHLTEIMEAKYRPGHFSGVAKVVSKLFNIIRPDHAFFGLKDLQQFHIISVLNRALHFDVQLHGIPTVREADGLAMSSRNGRLSFEEKTLAVGFYKALTHGKTCLNDDQTVKQVKRSVKNIVSEFKDLELEYFEIVGANDLKPVTKVHPGDELALCIAGYLGEVRLIDNIQIKSEF